MPLVVIEMPDADRASPHARTLVDTCSSAVAEGRCALAEGAEENDVTAVAIVRWEGAEQRSVSVTVGLRRTNRAQWLARQLAFREADAPRERWRAVGLVIATLVGEADRTARAAAAGTGGATPSGDAPAGTPSNAPNTVAPAAATSAPSNAPASPPASARSSPSGTGGVREVVWLDAGPVVEPSLGDGWLRVGGFLRASFRPGSPPVYVQLSARYAMAPTTGDSLSLTWASGAAGIGAFVGVPGLPFRLEGTIAAGARLVRARGADAGAVESGQRLVPAGRISVDGVWLATRGWALVAGGEVNQLMSGTEIRVASQREGRDPSTSLGASLALRATFR